ncbi:TPA: hypothetical protein RQK43_003683 [Vibrio vulnificus]|uniref:hypothetical protein n=1 Tax=Vibrio vulnificus TaxID=672 RepID=UPI0019D4C23C|nr:hypothetical protein [Vibrio vulnificus]ELY5144795.1 hypothetical protein [Vibrio vulnificus]MBN8146238.1 hypothetical protein [Vibrio vulnificus]MCA0779178.1 hypothetical protein [Vibrio vulnificus]MCU8316937.1 hypothetical protein [Vibrio vulnificus]NTJ40505.1 hypothetical protein [Vibrio vulnificus]
MNKKELFNEIERVNWSSYSGPSSFHFEKVPSAMKALIELDDSNNANEVGG